MAKADGAPLSYRTAVGCSYCSELRISMNRQQVILWECSKDVFIETVASNANPNNACSCNAEPHAKQWYGEPSVLPCCVGNDALPRELFKRVSMRERMNE